MSHRMQWIDNLKGFSALLVVIGHTITWSGLTTHISLLQFVYFYISSFHMSIFFVASGYVYGRVKEQRFDRSMISSNCLEVSKRAIDLSVPTILAMVVTFCITLLLGKFSLDQARSVSTFWFVWVIITIDIAHSIIRNIFHEERFVLPLLALLTLLFGIFFNTLGKFFGYFLLYELGVFLGHHLTKETEKVFFRASYGGVACMIGTIVIYLGYVRGGGGTCP